MYVPGIPCTSQTNIATGAITLYSWDNRNRLVEVTDETAQGQITQTVTYEYDAGNRWIGETVTSGGTTTQTRYVYDGNQIVMQFDKSGPGNVTAANLSHRYLWGPAVDQILADEQVTNPQTPGNVVWPLTDNLGTVRDLAVYNAQTGLTSVANHRVFDSFGNLLSQTNVAVDCLFGFTGLPFDKASGTNVTPTRRYDPATGRWDSPDSDGFKGGDTSLYRYCGNSPMCLTDPNGTDDGPSLGQPPAEPQRGTIEWADRVMQRWLWDQNHPGNEYWHISPEQLREAASIKRGLTGFWGGFVDYLDYLWNPGYTGTSQFDQVLRFLKTTPAPKPLPPPVDHPHSRGY